MVRLLALAVALSAGIALSCENEKDNSVQTNSGSGDVTNRVAPSLEGTLWQFIEIEGEPIVQFESEEAPQIRLISDEHTITAWLSCNLFEGTYETRGDSLQLRPTPVSWRECLESHEQEEAIRQIIQAVTRYGIDGDRLLLYADGQVVAVLAVTDEQ